ncbi:hypothetical protein [Amycolatopsis sp. 195334CR]|uniref:hypothetical protein n=1 Tax=Amycolatopsis sp. 195334CR TaxID=2814588 RepID=UPI001A8FD63F|nr:hypothetical protein [Amycolatopsis sp. 195334CR]MBN6038304.1 hypothetical protein [Amycolatopsis sp. 195334CR]
MRVPASIPQLGPTGPWNVLWPVNLFSTAEAARTGLAEELDRYESRFPGEGAAATGKVVRRRGMSRQFVVCFPFPNPWACAVFEVPAGRTMEEAGRAYFYRWRMSLADVPWATIPDRRRPTVF